MVGNIILDKVSRVLLHSRNLIGCVGDEIPCCTVPDQGKLIAEKTLTSVVWVDGLLQSEQGNFFQITFWEKNRNNRLNEYNINLKLLYEYHEQITVKQFFSEFPL